MDEARDILEEYVRSGKLMQVATISGTGQPAVCHVWYHVQFRPDRLYFISRREREHSANIMQDRRVAGGIVTIPLTALGQTVRGVTFKGRARELAAGAALELEQFLNRWPHAREAISVESVETNRTPSRLYEIQVSEWVLFDEKMFPSEPRRTLPAISIED